MNQKPGSLIAPKHRLSAANRKGVNAGAGDRHKLEQSDRRVWNTPQLQHLIEKQAQATPNAIAVEFESVSLTYQELELRTTRLATLLKKLGAGPEVVVALFTDRGLGMLVGILGILKSGAAYVPLDPAHPAARRDFFLTDSAAQILITTEEPQRLPQLPNLTIVSLDPDGQKSRVFSKPAKPGTGAEHPASPDNLAYLMYTSGSTGTPKGVAVTHRSVVNIFQSFAREPGFSSADTLVAVTTHSFDISVLELLFPLTVGARIVIANRVTRGRGDKLMQLLRESKATVMQATPATWYMLLDAGWEGGLGFKALCGGEVMPVDLARRLLAIGCRLWNLYGPTETTIWSTLHPVERVSQPISIGKPILNTTVLIANEAGEWVPDGELGEIFIGGLGVARGYHNRPELTNERFSTRSTPDGRVERFFKTGDFGCRLADGTLEFAGRGDRQVKLQGFRIELAEIETVLAEHPGVLKNAVVVEGEGLNKRLVGYVVPRSQCQVRTEEIFEIMRRKLPPYMFIQRLHLVRDLPLTANGKVDRKLLATNGHARPIVNGAAVNGQTPLDHPLPPHW